MKPAATTHYQALGVSHTATLEQIRRAYRAKARTLHPDVSKEPGAEKLFAAVARAYEVLSDRKARAEYDAQLEAGTRPTSPTTAHYSWKNIATEQSEGPTEASADFDELYETFFRPHRRQE